MPSAFQELKRPSLRSFMTLTIAFIVTVVLLFSISFFYQKTAGILRDSSQKSIVSQLDQVNRTITEQIETIDSVIPLFMSNNLILDALEMSAPQVTHDKLRFQVERQMSYIYSSTPLSGRNYTDSVYILCDSDTYFHTYTSVKQENTEDKVSLFIETIDTTDPKLLFFTLPDEQDHIYFARNLFNSNTGEHTGILVLNIDAGGFMDYCTKNVSPQWLVALYGTGIEVLSEWDLALPDTSLRGQLGFPGQSITFQELSLDGNPCFVAAQNLGELNLTSAVAAPKKLLLADLNDTLKSYLIILCVTILTALAAAIIISRAVTKPIDRMVFHINEISSGEKESLPPFRMYREFHAWTEAFNEMLAKLDASYNDNFQKQLLLKNAEIQALQSQMNPHFIFNVLNTIAWKAQMLDNEEIYQMVISLGELLRMDILSKNHAFVTLSQEMQYVRLYIYLQQMRFEDKISCTIQAAPDLQNCRIPCFCIQPLVENAIVHGLEPKKGKGRLQIQVLETDAHRLEISIIDDGIGFTEIPDIQSIAASKEDSHTHIGLRNLDKRLDLLFGSDARLRIESIPNKCTSVSFSLPLDKEGTQ